jgi:hypothetical protein
MLPEEREVEGREDEERIMNSASSGYLKAMGLRTVQLSAISILNSARAGEFIFPLWQKPTCQSALHPHGLSPVEST